MQLIESKNNTLLKEVKKLREKKHRSEKKQFLVEGFRFVEEALKSEYTIPYLLIKQSSEGKLDNFRKYLDNNTKIYYVNDTIFKEISNTENPQGIVAVVNMKENFGDLNDGFYILADKVQDPGNMGTIIRSAHASGAKGVIVTKGTVDIYNDKTLRSTMGSIFNISILEDQDSSIINVLKSKGFKFVVSSLEAENNFFEENLQGNIVICVGNEGNGISDDIYSLGDIKVKIPMPGKAESLNVSVAASIMMFEVVRQNFKKLY